MRLTKKSSLLARMIQIIQRNYLKKNKSSNILQTKASLVFLNKHHFGIITNYTNKFWLILHGSSNNVIYGIIED